LRHLQTGTLVRVRWIDSATAAGWVHKTEAFEPVTVDSVGTLVRQTKLSITLASTIGNEGQSYLEALSIPRGCILKMERL
jgi:hypothetical protein